MVSAASGPIIAAPRTLSVATSTINFMNVFSPRLQRENNTFYETRKVNNSEIGVA